MEDVCFVNLDGAEDESDISGLVWESLWYNITKYPNILFNMGSFS